MATGDLYINPGTTVDFTDSGGDVVLDLGANGAAGNVAISAQWDRGAGAQPHRYRFSLIIDGFATAPVVGEQIFLYKAEGRSSSDIDGDLAATSGTAGTVVLPNLELIGVATVQTTTAGDELRISGYVEISSRYVTFAVHNDTADALANSGDDHHLYLTPIPYQQQS